MFKFSQLFLIATIIHKQMMNKVPCDDNLENFSFIIFEDDIVTCYENESIDLTSPYRQYDIKILTQGGLNSYRIASKDNLNASCAIECDGCYSGNFHHCIQCSHSSRGRHSTYPTMNDILAKIPLDCSCVDGLVEFQPKQKQCMCNVQTNQQLSVSNQMECYQCPLNMAICQKEILQGALSYRAIKCTEGIGRIQNPFDNCECQNGYHEFNPIQRDCQVNTYLTKNQMRLLQQQFNCTDPNIDFSVNFVIRQFGNKYLCGPYTTQYENLPQAWVQSNTRYFPIILESKRNCSYQCSHCTTSSIYQCIFCSDNRRGSSIPNIFEVIQRLEQNIYVDCSCRTNFQDEGPRYPCSCPFLIEWDNENRNVIWNCTNCQKPCGKCIQGSNTLCSNCVEAIMIYDPIKFSCTCPTRYYMDKYCYPCYKTCETCDRWTANCLSCLEGSNRYFLNGQCVCPEHSVINDDPICQLCHWSCDTCLTTNTCQTCMQGDNRIIGPSGLCVCAPGYAEDYGSSICRKCIYTCLTCDEYYDSCSSCLADSFRYLEDQQCKCQNYYYDVGDAICQSCHFTCLHCNGPLASNCIQCEESTNRQLNQNRECICKQGYGYLDESTLECSLCNQTCQTCGQIDQCITCYQDSNRVLNQNQQCLCDQGYYEEFNTKECKKCHFTCQTCSDKGSDNCTSCNYDLGRELVNSYCHCLSGYYEIFKICAPCYYTCSSCINQYSNGCTTCPQSRQLLNDLNPSQCICKSAAQIDDGKSLECSYCHYTCKTCDGTQSNNCLTCYDQQESGTRLIKYGTCSCPPYWFDDGQAEQCQQCHPSCQSCFDSTIYGCITCSDLDFRHQLSTSCKCMDGYFEELSSPQKSCGQCEYRCATCVNDKSNCLSCPQDSKRLLTLLNNGFKTCSCPADLPNDVQDEPNCQQCHFSCANCSNPNINACTVCSNQYNRQLNTNEDGSFCVCKQSYYEVGKSECQSCGDKCQNCIDIPTNCTSCNPDQNRVLNGNVCICATRFGPQQLSYFDNLIDNDCVACHYSCQTCNGSQYNNCLTCSDLDYRVQQGSECVCKPKYIESGSRECLGCDYSCETCVNNKYSCTSCPIGSLRTLEAQSCDCPQGYYDAGIKECQKCDKTCNTCSNQSTTCLSCAIGSNRIYNQFSYSCDCQDGYYDGGEATCNICHFSCFRCSGLLKTDCTQCSDYVTTLRLLNLNTCICADRYYDDQTNQICKQCSSTCYNCQNNNNQCTQCYSNQKRILLGSSCNCIQNYYDAGKDVCEQCSQYCLSCQTGPDLCTACDQQLNRYLKYQKCECQDGFYDNLQLQCKPCHYSCLKCKDDQKCTACDANSLRELVNGQCICKSSTLEMGVQQCAICDQSCSTCFYQPNQCTSCNQQLSRILNGSLCLCQDGYFENNLQLCQPCNQKCATCINNEFNCLSCSIHKTLYQNTCECQNGYYTDLDNNCQLCSDKCLLCQITATTCINCKINRILKNNQCLCLDGQYETSQSACLSCSYKCKTCSGQPENCLSCSETANRVQQGNSCVCQPGFYDIGSNICMSCNFKCKTCQNDATSCLSCDQTLLRIFDVDKCICQPGYFDNGQALCQQCDIQCKTCIQFSYKCTSCDLNTFRMDESANFNKCPCFKGFYDDSTKVCKKCSYKCINCSDQFDNCTICNSNPGYFRENLLPQCSCQDGYFDDGIQVICQKCDFKCLSCNQTSTNCLLCENPQTRESSPQCDCRSGYYQDEKTQICKQCLMKCETCSKAADKCIICRPDRYSQKCICQDGYFEANQIYCQQCSHKCQTCQDHQLNCLVCSLNRINPPNCVCEDHYYDDYVNTQCQECDQYCGKCDFQGCIDCAANRVRDGRTCVCPSNSVSYEDIAWCSNCDVAVVLAQFSDDLKSINVKFEYLLEFHFPFQVDIQSQFLKIIHEQSLKLIGQSPQCSIEDNTLKIELGNGATVVVGDEIHFYPEYLKHTNCQNSLQLIKKTAVNQPLNLLKPMIKLTYPQFSISPCQQLQITIDQQLIAGERNLVILWKSSLPFIEVDQANSLQFQTLTIESGQLPETSQINISIEFKNFLNQTDEQLITINTLSSITPQISFQQQKKQFLAWIPIKLTISYSSKGCNQKWQEENKDKNRQIKIVFEEIENLRNPQMSKPLIFKQSEFVLFDEENVVTTLIPARQLSIKTNYSIKASYIDEKNQIYSSTQQDIQILKSPLLVQIKDGTRVINYLRPFTIEIQSKDPDISTEWNSDSEIQTEVSCLDMQNNNQSCTDIAGKVISLNKTQPIQYIGKNLFEPFSVLTFKVICKKQNLISIDQVQIIILDADLPSLNVNYPIGYTIRDININEQLQFEIQLNDDQISNNIQFRYCFIHNFETVFTQYNPNQSFKFNIWDHFNNFGFVNKIQIRLLAHDVRYLMPQQFSLLLSINLPPANSKITIQPKTGEAYFTKFQILVQDAKDKDSPLQYRFAYYKSYDLYSQDIENSQQDNLIIVQDFSTSQKFIGQLESGNLTCLISVSDSLGSIINQTQQITIEPFHAQMQSLNMTCETFIEQFLNNTFDVGQQIIIGSELIKMLNQNISHNCKLELHKILNEFQETLFVQLISSKNINLKTRISNLLNLIYNVQWNNSRRILQNNQSLCLDNGFIQLNNIQNQNNQPEQPSIKEKLTQLQAQIYNIIEQNRELIDIQKQSLDIGDEQTFRQLQQIFNLRKGLIKMLSNLYTMDVQDSRMMIRTNINNLAQSFQQNLDLDQKGIFLESSSVGVQVQKMGQVRFLKYLTNFRNDDENSNLNNLQINRFIQISKYQTNAFSSTEEFKIQFQNGTYKIEEINNDEVYYLKSLVPLDYQTYDPFIYVEAHDNLNQVNKIYQGSLAFNMGYFDSCNQQKNHVNNQLSLVCSNLENKQWHFDQCQKDYQTTRSGNTKVVCYCSQINPVTLMLLNITNQTKTYQVSQEQYSIIEQYIDVGLKYNIFNISIILLALLLGISMNLYTYFKPSIQINNIQIEAQRISTDEIEWLTKVTQFTSKLYKDNIYYLHEILRIFTTRYFYLSQSARILLIIFNIAISITIYHIIITFIRKYLIAISISVIGTMMFQVITKMMEGFFTGPKQLSYLGYFMMISFNIGLILINTILNTQNLNMEFDILCISIIQIIIYGPLEIVIQYIRLKYGFQIYQILKSGPLDPMSNLIYYFFQDEVMICIIKGGIIK